MSSLAKSKKPRRSSKKSINVDGIDLWECTRCHKVLDPAMFGSDARRNNGLKSHCKECCSDQEKQRIQRPEVKQWLKYRSLRVSEDRRVRHREYNRKRGLVVKYSQPPSEKLRAVVALNRAIASGKIARPSGCEVCGADGRTHAHHNSYDRDRWLTVTFMCPSCHRWTHEQWKHQEKGNWG